MKAIKEYIREAFLGPRDDLRTLQEQTDEAEIMVACWQKRLEHRKRDLAEVKSKEKENG
jgi:hypothetical protein